MKPTRWLVLLLAAVAPLVGATAAHAQPRPETGRKRYVRLMPEGDLSRILAGKLFEKQLDKFRQQYGKQWLLPTFDQKKLLADPVLQKQFLKALDANPGADKLDGARKALEQLSSQPPAVKAPGTKPPPPLSESAQIKGPPGAVPPVSPQDLGAGPGIPEPMVAEQGLQDQLAEWAQSLAHRLEGTALGERLRGSGAWQRGLQSLEGFLSDRAGGKFSLPGGGLGGLGERLRLPKDWGALMPDLAELHLPDIALPSLHKPNLNIALPRFGFGAPSLPGGGGVGGGLSAGQGALWVALLVLLGVLLWRLAGRGAWRTRTAAPASWQLGPWPVDPAQVSTRAELVRAFEHLALLRLGRDARAWNHREVAAHLAGADAAHGRAADALAALYEQARYAPDDEPLAAPNLAAARRDLCLLAGVATA